MEKYLFNSAFQSIGTFAGALCRNKNFHGTLRTYCLSVHFIVNIELAIMKFYNHLHECALCERLKIKHRVTIPLTPNNTDNCITLIITTALTKQSPKNPRENNFPLHPTSTRNPRHARATDASLPRQTFPRKQEHTHRARRARCMPIKRETRLRNYSIDGGDPIARAKRVIHSTRTHDVHTRADSNRSLSAEGPAFQQARNIFLTMGLARASLTLAGLLGSFRFETRPERSYLIPSGMPDS